MLFRTESPRLNAREWLFVACCTVSGTILYSTLIVLAVKPFVSDGVFDFLNVWVTVACVPALVWLGGKYVISQRKRSDLS
jgi:hypothetical protein